MPITEDCDDMMDGALVDIRAIVDGATLPTKDHRLLGLCSASLARLLSLSVGVGVVVLNWGDLRLDWPLCSSKSGSGLGRLTIPCLPILMNGTSRRERLENAVVAMNVCV